MKIKNIIVKNFRSICECDIEPSDFNISVGQNNHGKTNLFEAIRWFFSGFDTRAKETPEKICTKSKAVGTSSVTITFTGLQEAIASMTNEPKKRALNSIFNSSIDEITITRDCSMEDGKKRFLLKPTGEWVNTMGADGTWGDLLPKLEYIDTKTRTDDINGYKKSSPIAEMLSGVLGAIIETDPNYIKFKLEFTKLFSDKGSVVRSQLNNLGDKVQVYLAKQFPDGSKVEFSVNNPVFEDLLKNFSTQIDDGTVTNVEEKGDGMQRALMLSIIQAYADFRRSNEITRKFLFLIDEAELHLHPSAQRALKKALADIATNGEQVFINTHSSVLVVNQADNEKVFEVNKSNGVSSIKEVLPSDKQFIIFDLLGGSPTDILLPKNFLIVEGASESKFLKNIIAKFYPEYNDIFILSAEGDQVQQERSMNGVNKIYLPTIPIYRDKTVVLCDKPATKDKEEDISKFATSYRLAENEDYFILNEKSLEEYYPKEWRLSSEQVKELGEQNNKVSYANEVSSNITKDQFESDMPIIYNALKKTAERSF